MSRKLLLILIILFSAATAFSQKPQTCGLFKRDIPVIRKLKLGMSAKQLINTYPMISLKETKPIVGIIFPVIKKPTKDVKAIYIETANEKVISFKVEYVKDVSWSSAGEFAEYFTKAISLNIPASSWKKDDIVADVLESVSTQCKDFSLTFQLLKTSYSFELSDNNWLNEVDKGEEAKKKQFKP